MQSRANPEHKIESKTKDIEMASTRAMPNLEITIIDSNGEELRSSEALYDKAAKFIRNNSRVYLLAGACYSIVMTLIYLISTNFELLLVRILFLFITFMWPAVLVVYGYLVVDKSARLRGFLIYFASFFLVCILALVQSSDTAISTMLLGWIIFNVPATILTLAFLNRRIRAVGPLVLIFLILATTGSVIAVSILGYDEGLLESVANFGFSIGLDAYGVLIVIILIGFVLLGVIGWYVLKFLGKLYIDKKASDQSITADSLMLLYSILQSISLAFEGAIWIFSGLLGFLVYKIVSCLGFGMASKKGLERVHKLLLLRVFSLGKRSEVLFDRIGACWRQIGIINMIAGPDLATTTVEPHEFLSFIGGKLSRSFIDSNKTLEIRLSEVDLEPDIDGRYRVNEFFCFDDTWKMVLNDLVSESDVVLMDLRGFTERNDGCKHEIQELINLKPAKEILFIIDHTTDDEYLEQLIQDYWKNMRGDSPNLSNTSSKLKVFNYTQGNNDIRHMMEMMSGS